VTTTISDRAARVDGSLCTHLDTQRLHRLAEAEGEVTLREEGAGLGDGRDLLLHRVRCGEGRGRGREGGRKGGR
jgi:hypothetical protein